MPKSYEIVKRLGTAGLAVYVHKSDLHLINGFCVGLVIVVKKFIMSSPGSLLVFCITQLHIEAIPLVHTTKVTQ